MSFSLQILDDILINKVSELDSKINKIENRTITIDCSSVEGKLSVLEERLNMVENQCKILGDLFNVCRSHTLDNKLIQTMLLDLTTSIHNNSIEISVLKGRFEATTYILNNHDKDDDRDDDKDDDPYKTIATANQYSYIKNERNKWTKVKKKKKHRKR